MSVGKSPAKKKIKANYKGKWTVNDQLDCFVYRPTGVSGRNFAARFAQ